MCVGVCQFAHSPKSCIALLLKGHYEWLGHALIKGLLMSWLKKNGNSTLLVDFIRFKSRDSDEEEKVYIEKSGVYENVYPS